MSKSFDSYVKNKTKKILKMTPEEIVEYYQQQKTYLTKEIEKTRVELSDLSDEYSQVIRQIPTEQDEHYKSRLKLNRDRLEPEMAKTMNELASHQQQLKLKNEIIDKYTKAKEGINAKNNKEIN
ncbi:MAG: hypothetical protein HWN81_00210 [Candidatus Lokiarchaeota archaeon]|nr:hypothetical protein [Candidatus Lokiarchaeota archaeon]